MKNPTSLRITLTNAAVTIERDKVNCGFRIDRAWLELLPTANAPVHLHLEGKQGEITLKLPLVQAWILSAEIHERAIGYTQTTERTRSGRSLLRKKPNIENV